MTEDWRVVFQSELRQDCADRSLVLAAVGIPHRVIEDIGGYALIVEAEYSPRAAAELRAYDEENPKVTKPRWKSLDRLDPVPGVIGYLIMIVGIGWCAGAGLFDENWRMAGRVDGVAIRAGEWYRLVTALTLHGDLPHLAGNIAFGALFGVFAGRYAGSGMAWLVIVLCAAAGNGLNTLLLDETHRSIGASTAVFAALGLAAGFAWRAKVFSDGRWSSRIGPIVAGLALLMYSGTGDANTDIGAHFFGFACGFGGGTWLALNRTMLSDRLVQRRAGIIAIGIVVAAWILALGL